VRRHVSVTVQSRSGDQKGAESIVGAVSSESMSLGALAGRLATRPVVPTGA
jgi:hypothetical protein